MMTASAPEAAALAKRSGRFPGTKSSAIGAGSAMGSGWDWRIVTNKAFRLQLKPAIARDTMPGHPQVLIQVSGGAGTWNVCSDRRVGEHELDRRGLQRRVVPLADGLDPPDALQHRLFRVGVVVLRAFHNAGC